MNKTLIIYDGFCSFCTGLINTLLGMVNIKQFDILPCHLVTSSPYIGKITPDDCNKYIYVVTPDKKIHRGADAIMEIWIRIEHWSRPLGHVFKLPGLIHLCRVVYFFVGRRRYKFG